MIKYCVVRLICLYQVTLSPDKGVFKSFFPGGYCKYEPHCSEYCKQSVEKRGVVIGISRGLWRILRCNPWSKGGVDPA